MNKTGKLRTAQRCVSKRSQGLPISTVVIVIICVAVLAIFVIYVLTSGGKGFDISQFYWGSAGNMTKNASGQAGQPPTGGTLTRCHNAGEVCAADGDCCNRDKGVICRYTSYTQYTASKRTCGTISDNLGYCSTGLECTSGRCNTTDAVTAYCY